MPVTCGFDASGVAVLTVTAPYTFNEWRQAMDEIIATGSKPLRLLVDRRDAGTPEIDLVDQIVGYFRAHDDKLAASTVAIVVGGQAAYGMARMLEIRTEVSRVDMRTKIFLDYVDALRWLMSVSAETGSP